VLPIHGRIAPQSREQNVSDHPEPLVTHRFDRTLVLGQRIIEGEFLKREAQFLAAGCGFP
jgi:hypothetical protein